MMYKFEQYMYTLKWLDSAVTANTEGNEALENSRNLRGQLCI